MSKELKSKKKDETMTYKVENTKIIIGKKGVDIFLPHKKVSYNAQKAPMEYANYAMLFTGENEEEKLNYAKVLVGLEMLPSYGHVDADIAGRLLEVIVQDFVDKLNDATPRSEDEEEIIKDAGAILGLEISDMMSNEK